MIIQWGYIIPQPADGVHLSIWYSIDGGTPEHAVTYHCFYEDFLGKEHIAVLSAAFPGETVAFERLSTPPHYEDALLPYFIKVKV